MHALDADLYLVVRRCTYVRNCELGVHAHSGTRIVLTVRGRFESLYGRTGFSVAAERAIVRPAHVEHRDVFDDETVCLGILLPGTERRPANAFTVSDDELPAVGGRLYHELDATDFAADLVIASLCAQVEARIASGRDVEQPPQK